LDLYARLRQDRPALVDKLVFMTGGDFSGAAPRFPDGAKVQLLEKPFSIRSLRELAARAAIRKARGK
ncbi:MAG: hypothetical protein KC457_31735, partial [Myxococcales bacterium]|nr:hypothetical protein [Myxococcales bacterium]